MTRCASAFHRDIINPMVGDIRQPKGRNKQVWQLCPDCKRAGWVTLKNGQPRSLRCQHCNIKRVTFDQKLERHPAWRGGFSYSQGYTLVRLRPDNPYYSMADKHGYVRQHRLIMAQHLRRCLMGFEQVHHLNGITQDNRIENLQLISRIDHILRTKLCSRCELRKEIRLLRWQLKELSLQLQQTMKLGE